MRTIIIGAGVVGLNIASRLVDEGHDVTVVDTDQGALDRISNSLDVNTVRGHGSHPKVLLSAMIQTAQMIVSVTDSDEVNMIACVNAGVLGDSELIRIARVREPSYSHPDILDADPYGLNLIINPEQETAHRISALLRYPNVTEMLEFAEGRVHLVGVRVTSISPLAGIRLLEIRDRFSRVEFLIAAITRGDEVIIPTGATVVLPGDEVHIVTRSKETEAVLSNVGIKVTPVKRVMIIGGSRTGLALATFLERRGLVPKLVESDERKANELAEMLTSTVVIHGSPTDTRLLNEENASEMNTFVACDDREETNLMAALLGREMGAKRIIVTTNEPEYRPLIKSAGADVCLSPRMVAVSSILHFIRRGRVVAVQALGDGEAAEALEFEAQLASDAVGVPLRELNLPRGALIAALVREDSVLIPGGDTVINAGDHVVVLSRQEAVHPVERLLQRRVDRD